MNENVIVAEHCPTCGEAFHPERPGTGELCGRCRYEGRAAWPADAIVLDTAAGAELAAQVQAEADDLDDAEPVEQVPPVIADMIAAGWIHDTTTEIVSPDGVEYVLRRDAGPVAEVTLFATSARVELRNLTEAEALAAIRAIGGAR